jgi:hypothetical protein
MALSLLNHNPGIQSHSATIWVVPHKINSLATYSGIELRYDDALGDIVCTGATISHRRTCRQLVRQDRGNRAIDKVNNSQRLAPRQATDLVCRSSQLESKGIVGNQNWKVGFACRCWRSGSHLLCPPRARHSSASRPTVWLSLGTGCSKVWEQAKPSRAVGLLIAMSHMNATSMAWSIYADKSS